MWSITMQIEEDIYEAEHEKIIGLKNTLSVHSEDWVSVDESDLKVGDIVYVEYSPDSQKHIYTHYPEYGTVREIGSDEYYSPSDDKIKKEISIKILNYDGQLVKLNKDHLSMYSRGYCIYIKKYEINHIENV
jgi:hypothetical protein